MSIEQFIMILATLVILVSSVVTNVLLIVFIEIIKTSNSLRDVSDKKNQKYDASPVMNQVSESKPVFKPQAKTPEVDPALLLGNAPKVSSFGSRDGNKPK